MQNVQAQPTSKARICCNQQRYPKQHVNITTDKAQKDSSSSLAD